MKREMLSLSGGCVLTLFLFSVVSAQDATTKTTTTTTTTARTTVQNPDGSYSVIEYPVGKEVTVELTPMNLQGAKGMARVMRSTGGTNVALDLSGLPADAKSYYVYAVDPSGAVTLLGPTPISNGIGTATFTTPMNQFMLVLSPNEGLTTIGGDTPIAFRSAVPQGYAVVGNRPSNSIEETKQVAGSAPVSSTYEVPLLGIPSLGDKDFEIRVQFSGELQGLKGKAYLDPQPDGVIRIKMRFDDMKMAPKHKRFVLWAVSPDRKYTKIGQVINTGQRQEAEIRGETALSEFGLFVTMEETDVNEPRGTVYAPLTTNRDRARVGVLNTISGTVKDSNNNPIPKAKVKISKQGGGFRQEKSADSDGNYKFEGIPAGTYTVTACSSSGSKCQTKISNSIKNGTKDFVDFP